METPRVVQVHKPHHVATTFFAFFSGRDKCYRGCIVFNPELRTYSTGMRAHNVKQCNAVQCNAHDAWKKCVRNVDSTNAPLPARVPLLFPKRTDDGTVFLSDFKIAPSTQRF